MKKINLKLSFQAGNEVDAKQFTLIVPNRTTVNEIQHALQEFHIYLKNEDKTGTYERNGEKPETLLTYVCEEYGWIWMYLNFQIDLNFKKHLGVKNEIR